MTVTTVPSTVPGVCNYLFTNISSAVGYDASVDQDQLAVTLGEPPTAGTIPNNLIAIGQVRHTDTPATLIGSGMQYWLNEVYDVEVNINCWMSTGDADLTSNLATELNNQAWALLDYVYAVVRDDPSLGAQVNQAYPHSASTPGPVWIEDPAGGMGVGITVQIHVESLN